jgi:hypothetical protein
MSILSNLSSKISTSVPISSRSAFVFTGLAFAFSIQASVASWQAVVSFR